MGLNNFIKWLDEEDEEIKVPLLIIGAFLFSMIVFVGYCFYKIFLK